MNYWMPWTLELMWPVFHVISPRVEVLCGSKDIECGLIVSVGGVCGGVESFYIVGAFDDFVNGFMWDER